MRHFGPGFYIIHVLDVPGSVPLFFARQHVHAHDLGLRSRACKTSPQWNFRKTSTIMKMRLSGSFKSTNSKQIMLPKAKGIRPGYTDARLVCTQSHIHVNTHKSNLGQLWWPCALINLIPLIIPRSQYWPTLTLLFVTRSKSQIKVKVVLFFGKILPCVTLHYTWQRTGWYWYCNHIITHTVSYIFV